MALLPYVACQSDVRTGVQHLKLFLKKVTGTGIKCVVEGQGWICLYSNMSSSVRF